MKKTKSKGLKNLLINFRLAQFSNNNPEIEVEKIIEFKNSDDMSRRKFIEEVALFGLLTGFIGTSAFGSTGKKITTTDNFITGKGNLAAKDKRVVIIGGGIAGLNAAHQLKKAGIKAMIYEGSNRMGGRILTHYDNAMKMDAHPEFGGDFIDSTHADMLTLVKEFNLELIDLYEESSSANLLHETFFFDGRHISEKEIIEEFKKIIPVLEKDTRSLGENYDTPEGLVLDKMTLKHYIEALDCVIWLKEILTAAFIAEYGLDTSQQSAINMLSVISTDISDGFKVFGSSDEKYRIKNGNSQLVTYMAINLEDSIVLKHMLTAITKQADKYILSFKEEANVEADYVIITIPFTMLRDVKIDLPEMTAEKMNSIQELGYGQSNKLFLGYDNKPWREGGNKFYGYLFHKDITNGWDASTSEFNQSEKGVYCCYLGGDESIRLSDLAIRSPRAPKGHVWKTDLPQVEIDKYVNELEHVFPGSKKRYANKHVFASWTTYPYVKGCYTCAKPGQWNGALKHAQEPVGDVYFAGEHCSADFQGFLNGAAETGRVAAEKIIEKVNKL